MTKCTMVIALACAIAFASAPTFGRNPAGRSSTPLAGSASAEHISQKQLRDYLTFVASDEMEGRDTPSRGLDTTARFIATLLSRWGLVPAGDSGTYFQKIELVRDVVVPEKSSLTVNGTAFPYGDGWFARPASGKADANAVYVGHGWVNPEKSVDPYAGLDVKGKIVVAQLSYLPPGGSFQDLRSGSTWKRPSVAARERGAIGIVYVPAKSAFQSWERLRGFIGRATLEMSKFHESATAELPSAVAGMELSKAIFAGESSDIEAILKGFDSGTFVPGFALTPAKRLTLEIATRSEKQWTQNVVATWPGSDPKLKDEYVAFGAHYDHVGVNEGAEGDKISNGADDDGSGTVALISIAEALAKAEVRPKRSILLVWHCGEEKGLWGSRYFTEYPTVPLNQIVAQLNIDMIGRSKKPGDVNERNAALSGPDEVYAIGSRMMSDQLAAMNERVNGEYLKISLNYKYDDPNDQQRLFYRSDHYNYAKKGIPIIFFFSGLHEDYHRVGDEVEKIDFRKLERVTRTIYVLGWALAESPTRPKVDRPLPATAEDE
ncbi:MAG: M20/M25/M40 family metallo-hydrolase [Acidobacteria bacterium]|nr:M20/M25/M40 family metallo-hydrolase [Acidobacteriota bacterium]